VSSANDQCPQNGSLISQATYYADTDGDGAGDASSTIGSCDSTPPSGYVTTSNDGCPSDSGKTAPGTCGCGTADSDSDGDGTPDCLDYCPNDPAKTSPGSCGCGIVDTDFNSNGIADCLENSPIVGMSTATTSYSEGDTLRVRISTSPVGVIATGVQLAVTYDATRLLLVSATPASGAPFTAESLKTIDNASGTLKYTLGLASGASGTAGGGDLADLEFVVLPASTLCSQAGEVRFGSIGAYSSQFATQIGQPMLPITTGLGAVRIDSTGPAFSGLFANSTIATDAGSTYGGYLAQPSVVATDDCDGVQPASLSIMFPNASTATTWPANGLFPIGTSSVTWTATDTLGNFGSATRTITVGNYQLADAGIVFGGVLQSTSTRQIRIKAGASTQVLSVALTGSSGSIAGIQVPVAASYPCMSAKDPVHSVTDAATPSIVNRKYAVSFNLVQGDANDDDVVDILDFGAFVSARGGNKARNAASNYNADTVINNGDFSFISLNFFSAGDSCSSGYEAPRARTRVSVKDLRRAGLGELAVADFNRDGWVDTTDIQVYMQTGVNGAPSGGAGAPSGSGDVAW